MRINIVSIIHRVSYRMFNMISIFRTKEPPAILIPISPLTFCESNLISQEIEIKENNPLIGVLVYTSTSVLLTSSLSYPSTNVLLTISLLNIRYVLFSPSIIMNAPQSLLYSYTPSSISFHIYLNLTHLFK